MSRRVIQKIKVGFTLRGPPCSFRHSAYRRLAV